MPVRKPSMRKRIHDWLQKLVETRRLKHQLKSAYQNIDLLANVNQELYNRNHFLEQEIALMRSGIQNVR